MSLVIKGLLCFLISFGVYAKNSLPVQAQQFEKIWAKLLTKPKTLEHALRLMPKGADLHCHASGATSTEELIQIAKNNDYCIDNDLAIHEVSKSGTCQAGIKTKQFLALPEHQKSALRAWSMADFKEGSSEDGKTHFFKTFPKFSPMVASHWPEIIANVREQADVQHIQYLELMLDINGTKPKASKRYQYSEMKNLIQGDAIKAFIRHNIGFFSSLKAKVDAVSSSAAKQVDVRWILEIKRNQEFRQFALDAYEVFTIASGVSDIVGINMVEAEYGKFANADYELQMQWIAQLHRDFPKVNIVLHAGELPKSIALHNTKGHIAEALKKVKPLRIGHGVTILSEPKFEDSLQALQENHIAVEVNLTSNDEILGVKGRDHPLSTYLKYGVPVVISSDDPGVSRNNLSHEYYRAIREQNLSLKQFLQVNRNSLTYSLLPGASIWKDADKLVLVDECQELLSSSCKAYIVNSPKAKQQWLLEQNLLQFFSNIIT